MFNGLYFHTSLLLFTGSHGFYDELVFFLGEVLQLQIGFLEPASILVKHRKMNVYYRQMHSTF